MAAVPFRCAQRGLPAMICARLQRSAQLHSASGQFTLDGQVDRGRVGKVPQTLAHAVEAADAMGADAVLSRPSPSEWLLARLVHAKVLRRVSKFPIRKTARGCALLPLVFLGELIIENRRKPVVVTWPVIRSGPESANVVQELQLGDDLILATAVLHRHADNLGHMPG